MKGNDESRDSSETEAYAATVHTHTWVHTERIPCDNTPRSVQSKERRVAR